MTPLHLLVHSENPEHAARIAQALRTGAPECTVATTPDAAALVRALADRQADGGIADLTSRTADQAMISPALRHELNNHLALIRILADFLAEDRGASAALAARAREIGTAAEAAAQALRRTKSSAG